MGANHKGVALAKKRKPKQPKRKLPAGAKPQPVVDRLPPVQRIQKPKCPFCGTNKVECTGSPPSGIRYYRCRECANPETGDWTRFKVLVS